MPMESSNIEAMVNTARQRADLQEWIQSRKLADTDSADFALTPRTKRLCTDSNQAIKMFATVVALPVPPWKHLWEASDLTIYSWLKDKGRRYDPFPEASEFPGEAKAMHNGVIMAEDYYRNGSNLWRYLTVERNGIVELGLGNKVCRVLNDERGFLLTPIVANVWHLLGFLGDLYSTFEQDQPFTLLVNLRETEKALLAGLAYGWTQPWSQSDWKPRCNEVNVQIRHNGLGPVLAAEAAKHIATEIAYEIEAAWGMGGTGFFPRCFRQTKDGKQGDFDLSVIR